MKGGARATSGPAPAANALRRERDGGDWVTLPQCRDGDAPEWPLSTASDRELELWVREWRRPQAVMWERDGQELEVAMYVRSVVEAERPGAVVAARTLVRQQQEALGLSQPGLARNRWRIGDAAPEAQEGAGSGPSARDRFKVVSGGRA